MKWATVLPDGKVSCITAGTAGTAWPRPDSLEALIAAPDFHTLLLENEHVRVLDVRIGPGQIVPVHTHRWPSVLYVFRAGDLVRRDADGKVQLDTRVGQSPVATPSAMWSAPFPPHSIENVGHSENRVISVELKGRSGASRSQQALAGQNLWLRLFVARIKLAEYALDVLRMSQREATVYRTSFFNRAAKATARTAGHPAGFVFAVLTIVVWMATGSFFHFSDTWQLVINTGTTIVTFLMVFLIQNTQNRDSEAMHLKLDELIRAVEGAHNALLDIEELSEQELDMIRERYEKLAQKAREELKRGKRDTGTPKIASS